MNKKGSPLPACWYNIDYILVISGLIRLTENFPFKGDWVLLQALCKCWKNGKKNANFKKQEYQSKAGENGNLFIKPWSLKEPFASVKASQMRRLVNTADRKLKVSSSLLCMQFPETLHTFVLTHLHPVCSLKSLQV